VSQVRFYGWEEMVSRKLQAFVFLLSEQLFLCFFRSFQSFLRASLVGRRLGLLVNVFKKLNTALFQWKKYAAPFFLLT
jgi:hypothetical protein